VNAELSTRGALNKGKYYSLATINDNFFDKDAKAKQDEKLTKTNMPFLYTFTRELRGCAARLCAMEMSLAKAMDFVKL
jgi:hypothetical protein